jgi:hypothetical protein
MYLRLFFKLIAITALIIFQIGFISGLPVWARELNLIIIFLIFSLEFGGNKKAIWWFLLIGFLFDIYIPIFFGFFIIFWPLVFLFASFLYTNFFTNRSLYSFLGLTFFTTIFYYFLFNIFFYLASFFSGARADLFFLSKNFWIHLGGGIAANLLAVTIIFYLANLISDRLKPVFIIKKQ